MCAIAGCENFMISFRKVWFPVRVPNQRRDVKRMVYVCVFVLTSFLSSFPSISNTVDENYSKLPSFC